MASTTLVPTSVTDTSANLSTSTITDVDNTIASADGNTNNSVTNGWTNGPGTGSAFSYTMSNLPGDFGTVNTVQVRVRWRVNQTDQSSDTWGCTWDVQGTNAPASTASIDSTGGTTFINSGDGSPVASSASESDINGWTVRVWQDSWSQNMSPDGYALQIDEVEVIVDYNAAAAAGPNLLTLLGSG